MSKNRKYETSDETQLVLSSHIQQVAQRKGCTGQYVTAVRNGDRKDPFIPFLEWFEDCAWAGAPVKHYIDRLEGIVVNADAESAATCVSRLPASLVDKIQADAHATAAVTAALADMRLTAAECRKILSALDTATETVNELRQTIIGQLAKLS